MHIKVSRAAAEGTCTRCGSLFFQVPVTGTVELEEAMKRLIALAAMVPLMAFPVLAQDDAKMRGAQDGNTQTMSNEISASALLNENVVNANNETIGDVNDVLLGKDGKVASVIVGVGGFLGMGEKNVALSFDQLKFTNNGNDLVVTSDATKESLQAAPAYDSSMTAR
jgi:sporulation protein YlmC with PRC-barrel domain